MYPLPRPLSGAPSPKVLIEVQEKSGRLSFSRVENIKEPPSLEEEAEVELPSHKFQRRIGRLDRHRGWINEIQWELQEDSGRKAKKEPQFAIKISLGPPGPPNAPSPEMMTLSSPYIRKVFNQVVEFFPGVNFRKDSIEMTFPFAPLYHYFKDMKEFVENDKSEDINREDFEVLEWYHDKYLVDHYNSVRSFISLANVSFEYLWAIFRPGDLIVTRDELGHRQLHVLALAEVREKWSAQYFTAVGRSVKMLFLKAWSIVWSPSAQTFQRALHVFALPQFVGSKGITSLDVYPLSFEDVTFQEALKKKLIENGTTWKKLVSERPTCWHYKGAAFDGQAAGGRRAFPGESSIMTSINIDERVIVDQAEVLDLRKMVAASGDLVEPQDRQIENVSSVDGRVEYASYDNLSSKAEFTPFQAMLCPPVITGFCLKTTKWRTVSVSKLTPIKWNKAAFNQLVLQQRTKKLLAGLIRQHAAGLKGKSDFIKDKGKGLTIVLYGPSGVGKTFTAESIAEHNEIPLRPINISNLISTDGGREAPELSKVFAEAERWDAILLIDEADVVLEKRALEDVRRNAIVSAFLRELEYFSGILFLTTNRIETMDRAFQSRIQVAVEYKSLPTSSRRKIWEAFVQTLPLEEERDELEPHVDAWQTHQLNGRQIRNVMNLARSLALDDVSSGRLLRSDHVESAIEETLKFQELFMRWENEPQRIVGKSLRQRRGKKKVESEDEEEDDD